MAHTQRTSGPNTKANELLHRRLTVEDAARAHLVALERAPSVGFGSYIVSAPTPFAKEDCRDLKRDAAGVVGRLFPQAAELYAQKGWQLPPTIGRIYDASRAERELGFRCATTFETVLAALRNGDAPPFIHDPSYTSPKLR